MHSMKIHKQIAIKDCVILVYTTLYVLAAVMTYSLPMRQISLFGFTTYGPVLILPIWYVIGDAIAELFGMAYSRFLIWMSIMSCLLFALIISGIMKIPYPANWSGEVHFDYVFGDLLKISILCNVAAIIGGYLNAYFLIRWKFLLKGRYFFLRSIGSSFIGDFVQITVSSFIVFYSLLPFGDFIKTIFISYLFHIILMTLYSIPNSYIVSLLKLKLQFQEVSSNPFAENKNL